MEIFLVLLLLIKSVFGDKLSNAYLPPPDANLSAGDLNYSDLPFELPSQSLYKNLKTTSAGKEIGNYFIDSRGSEPVSYDNKAPSSTTSASTTTLSSIAESFSTPSTQMATVTDFTYDSTETKIPQDINQLQGSDVPFSFDGIINSTSVGAMPVTGIEEKYPFSSSLSNQEPSKIIENQIPNMSFNYPSAKSDKDVEIFVNQHKNDKYLPRLNEPTFTSARRIDFQNNDRNAINTNQIYNLASDGFSYSFETSNGMHTDVSGTATDGIKSKGSFSYTGDDGKVYKMEYTADENGFQPRGAHLPTPPPVPKEIQEVIEQAYKNKAAGIFDDGSYSDEKYGYKNYMPRYDKKAIKPNKDNKISKKTMVQPLNIFDDYYSQNFNRPSINGIMPMNNEVIPVQVIYDEGYNYSQPQNKLHLPGLIGHQTEYSSSESPKPQIGDIKSVENVNDENSYNNSQNNDTTDNTEESNPFGPTNEISSYENNQPFSLNNGNSYESENYKTTEPIFSTTYAMDFNHLNGDNSRVSSSQTEIVTGFPSTTTPFNSLKNTNTPGSYKSRYIPEDDEIMISTANPEWVTTASPRTKSVPVYVQTQTSGEDFSGPKQLPTYNPKSGYYY